MIEKPTLSLYRRRAESATREGEHAAVSVDARLFIDLVEERRRLINALELVLNTSPFGHIHGPQIAKETLEAIK